MQRNIQEGEPILDPRAEKLTDELLKLVEGDLQETQRSIHEVIHGGKRINAVKMMLTWAVARSEANHRRSLGFGTHSPSRDHSVSQEVLDENRATAARVADDMLRTFFETAGAYGNTFLQTGKLAQASLDQAMSQEIPVAEVAELFHRRLEQRTRGQRFF